MKLDKKRTLKIVKAALKEDIGTWDTTTSLTIPKLESVKASIVAREDCVLSGMDIAEWIISCLDYSVRFKPQATDGRRIYKGKEIAFLEGHARAILSAERTMLNFLCLLSGITTNVTAFVKKTEKYGVKIYDTRKTFPLLRYLERYAVEVGGGHNHRFGLWDQVLIKDNHLKTISHACPNRRAISQVLRDLRKKVQKNIKIEIEVANLKEFEDAIKGKPDIIMLDNMNVGDVKKAVHLRNKPALKSKPLLEVSGGITIDTVEGYAATGVDRISVGALTHSVKSIDMSLEINA